MICVMCGLEAAPTREHVYPKWVRDGLGATGRTTITRTKGRRSHQQVTTGLTVILRRSVCRACNTGWMSTSLESSVKDLLLPPMWGRRSAFRPEEQRLIAAWAVKTALMLELKAVEDRRQAGYAPESNLRWLYSRKADPEPPPGSQVWIACVDAELLTPDALTGWYTVTTSNRPHDMEYYAVTFSVGYLVFQVSGQDFTEPELLAGSGQPLATLQRPDELLSYVNAIWPARDLTIDWPRSYRLRRSEMSRFASWENTVAARQIIVPIPRLGT